MNNFNRKLSKLDILRWRQITQINQQKQNKQTKKATWNFSGNETIENTNQSIHFFYKFQPPLEWGI